MPRYLLKKVSPSPTKGDVAAIYVDAPSPEAALAKAPVGCWKLHRRVDEDEQGASRSGVVLAPCFQVPGGRGGRSF